MANTKSPGGNDLGPWGLQASHCSRDPGSGCRGLGRPLTADGIGTGIPIRRLDKKFFLRVHIYVDTWLHERLSIRVQTKAYACIHVSVHVLVLKCIQKAVKRCMHMHTLFSFICIDRQTDTKHANKPTHTHMHTHTHTRTHTHAHKHSQTHKHIQTRKHTHTHTHTPTFVTSVITCISSCKYDSSCKYVFILDSTLYHSISAKMRRLTALNMLL